MIFNLTVKDLRFPNEPAEVQSFESIDFLEQAVEDIREDLQSYRIVGIDLVAEYPGEGLPSLGVLKRAQNLMDSIPDYAFN
jgi:hypothetical protein